MERKRRLPPRAAARAEQEQQAKRRSTRQRSPTPPLPEPVVEEAPPTPSPLPAPPLPTSIEPGKPLPTIEIPQPEDLSLEDYQSIQESGVLTESLSRSRQKWISEGLFEKYWTKPHKRKGVMIEDPKNPPKDSMTKVGTVTITIEPHIIEATMYAVKGPKPRPPPPHQEKIQQQRPPQQQPPARPIIQYGPANGSMPPPPSPMPVARSPSITPQANRPATTAGSGQNSPRPSPAPHHQASPVRQTSSPTPSAPLAQPGGQAMLPSPNPGQRPSPGPNVSPASSATPQAQRPGVATSAAAPSPKPAASRPTNASQAAPSASTSQQGAARKPSTTPGQSPASAPAKPAANDPVIALLAQKASGDPELRDLMKRVAVGQAKEGELAHFQKIIDQLNAEYKRKGGQQGPSADRLLVDGRTVKYFADEVRTILDIVLASNPNQKSTELRPPPGSDPLVVLLVKTALEDQRTRDMIRRIAEGRPGFTDATDLKEILDRLHRDAKTIPQGIGAQPPAKQVAPNGAVPNGPQAKPHQPQMQAPNPQTLRSKGPPASNRPDVAAVVLDFGTGDRYLFPKYSILEYLPTTSGQQVLASFLIVRKGSISEYGGDPELDYYQPVTIRLQTQTGRHLENLARVVAPQDEVRRYMDDVMDNMTRAEYVLLAMRLPRTLQDSDQEQSDPVAEKKSPSPQALREQTNVARPQVLWGTKSSINSGSSAATPRSHLPDPAEEEQQRYHRLIRSVEEKEYEYV